MKKYFTYGGVFLGAYLTFLVITIPAKVALSYANLPSNIGIYGLSGTIWHSKIDQVAVNQMVINQVDAQLSWISLIAFSPKVEVTFGDAILAGPEGRFTLELSKNQLVLQKVNIQVSANHIAEQLALPLPITAFGSVEVTLVELALDLNENFNCLAASGRVHWQKSAINALQQNIQLGSFSAKASCEQGALLMTLNPKNNLGLSFDAYVRLGQGRVYGQGYVKPGGKFPTQLTSALPFLGKADNQGRYKVSI